MNKNKGQKDKIDNSKHIQVFEHYLLEHCSNNPRLFKIPQFGNYLRSNGFPQVADTTIRRKKEFRQTLNDRLELFEDDTYQTVITYKTLDVERFLITNRTPKAIKSALMELNNYYKRVVDAAIEYKEEASKLKTRVSELKNEVAQLNEKNAEILRLYEQLKAKDRQLSEKDEQMRIKDRQIAEKDKQLDQQQQLTLQAMKDQETLKLELDQAKEEVQSTKKGFFARLFGG